MLDVRDADAVTATMNKAASHFGAIDGVINNAGAIYLAGTESTPAKRFDLMHAVNTRGTFLCAQAAIPHLRKNGGGHILNLSPPLDLQPKWFAPHVAYTITKFGMSMITMGMAAEFKDAKISVNSLWPRTIIATDALRAVGGMSLANAARTPAIMAEAAFHILGTPPGETTGECLLDEDFLRTRGVEDFTEYSLVPGATLMTDLFVEEKHD